MRIPIIGLGGIETVDDVLEYLAVGATAVQVGTASFVRPGAVGDLSTGLRQRILGYKLQNIQDLTKVLVPSVGLTGRAGRGTLFGMMMLNRHNIKRYVHILYSVLPMDPGDVPSRANHRCASGGPVE